MHFYFDVGHRGVHDSCDFLIFHLLESGEHQKFALLMLDIDHFKKINDTHGHLVGDEAIRHVARRAVQTLRTTDVVARYGGEEFVVFLPGEDLDGAAQAAERLREAVREPFVPGGLADVALTVTVSVGVTAFRPSATDVSALLGEADQALYRSKQGGRNRVTVFSKGESK